MWLPPTRVCTDVVQLLGSTEPLRKFSPHNGGVLMMLVFHSVGRRLVRLKKLKNRIKTSSKRRWLFLTTKARFLSRLKACFGWHFVTWPTSNSNRSRKTECGKTWFLDKFRQKIVHLGHAHQINLLQMLMFIYCVNGFSQTFFGHLGVAFKNVEIHQQWLFKLESQRVVKLQDGTWCRYLHLLLVEVTSPSQSIKLG